MAICTLLRIHIHAKLKKRPFASVNALHSTCAGKQDVAAWSQVHSHARVRARVTHHTAIRAVVTNSALFQLLGAEDAKLDSF